MLKKLAASAARLIVGLTAGVRATCRFGCYGFEEIAKRSVNVFCILDIAISESSNEGPAQFQQLLAQGALEWSRNGQT